MPAVSQADGEPPIQATPLLPTFSPPNAPTCSSPASSST